MADVSANDALQKQAAFLANEVNFFKICLGKAGSQAQKSNYESLLKEKTRQLEEVERQIQEQPPVASSAVAAAVTCGAGDYVTQAQFEELKRQLEELRSAQATQDAGHESVFQRVRENLTELSGNIKRSQNAMDEIQDQFEELKRQLEELRSAQAIQNSKHDDDSQRVWGVIAQIPENITKCCRDATHDLKTDVSTVQEQLTRVNSYNIVLWRKILSVVDSGASASSPVQNSASQAIVAPPPSPVSADDLDRSLIVTLHQFQTHVTQLQKDHSELKEEMVYMWREVQLLNGSKPSDRNSTPSIRWLSRSSADPNRAPDAPPPAGELDQSSIVTFQPGVDALHEESKTARARLDVLENHFTAHASHLNCRFQEFESQVAQHLREYERECESVKNMISFMIRVSLNAGEAMTSQEMQTLLDNFVKKLVLSGDESDAQPSISPT